MRRLQLRFDFDSMPFDSHFDAIQLPFDCKLTSNSRTAVESKTNRSCNPTEVAIKWLLQNAVETTFLVLDAGNKSSASWIHNPERWSDVAFVEKTGKVFSGFSCFFQLFELWHKKRLRVVCDATRNHTRSFKKWIAMQSYLNTFKQYLT